MHMIVWYSSAVQHTGRYNNIIHTPQHSASTTLTYGRGSSAAVSSISPPHLLMSPAIYAPFLSPWQSPIPPLLLVRWPGHRAWSVHWLPYARISYGSVLINCTTLIMCWPLDGPAKEYLMVHPCHLFIFSSISRSRWSKKRKWQTSGIWASRCRGTSGGDWSVSGRLLVNESLSQSFGHLQGWEKQRAFEMCVFVCVCDESTSQFTDFFFFFLTSWWLHFEFGPC